MRSVQTPLYAACNIGHVEIVKLLLSVNGIDVNAGVSIDVICMHLFTYFDRR